MKVIHISYARTWGGGEQQMVDLIFALNNLEVKNTLICLKDSDLNKYAEKNGLDFQLISGKKIKHIKSIFKSNPYDVLHIHTGSFIKNFILLNLFHGLKIPCIYTINGIMRKKSFLSKLKYNYSKINIIHFVSNAAKFNFEKNVAFKKTLNRLYTVYDGIQSEIKTKPKGEQLSDLLPITEANFLVGNIANHTRAKNLISFLKVANYLVNEKKEKQIHFVQVGRKTNLTDDLLSYISTNNLESNVHFLGFVDKAEQVIPSLNTFLITSNREGLPLTILESFKYKIPVVSTNAGGIPEAIVSGDNGFISDIDDHVSLGNQILEIYHDKELSDKFVKASHRLFTERFTADRMGMNTKKLYNKILNEN